MKKEVAGWLKIHPTTLWRWEKIIPPVPVDDPLIGNCRDLVFLEDISYFTQRGIKGGLTLETGLKLFVGIRLRQLGWE
jgi:hypothetical protein